MKTDNETNKSKAVTSILSSGGLISLDELDHFFDDFLTRRWPGLVDWNFSAGLEKSIPTVDILDHDQEIEVQAALPGVKKEDLDISINNQTLCIRAASKEDKKQEEGKYFRREISRGAFQRTLSLPDNIDSDNASASFTDGILKISIPKTEKSKRKAIEIK